MGRTVAGWMAVVVAVCICAVGIVFCRVQIPRWWHDMSCSVSGVPCHNDIGREVNHVKDFYVLQTQPGDDGDKPQAPPVPDAEQAD